MPARNKSARSDRLDARIPADLKAMLVRAAALQGQSPADFVVSSATEGARRVIRESELLELTERDQVAFAETLLNPPQAPPRLRTAAEVYAEARRAFNALSWIISGVGRPTIRLPGRDPETGFSCKGRRIRAIPLSERAQAFMEEAATRWGTTGFVLHDQKTPPNTSNWCRDTHAACQKASVTDVDTHGLRRTAGVLWLAAGLDIYTVSRLLGHQSVTTTERSYAGISHGHWAAAMDAVDARARLPKIPTKGRAAPERDQGTDVPHVD